MKTAHLFSTGLTCVLFAARTLAAADVAADWNVKLGSLQQTSHQNAAGRTRADAIMHAVLAATVNGIESDKQSGRLAEPVPAGANLDVAAAQAAYSALTILYPQNTSALDAQLADSLAVINDSASSVAAGKKWGEHVAKVVLAEQSDAVSLNSYSFAEEVQPPASAPLAFEVHAEQQAEQAAAIGPGRYRFSVLAGTPGTKGYVDGTETTARFDNPSGIVVDAAGNVYVSEHDSCTIRKISPDGLVTTLAGAAGQKGSEDGMGSAARFNQPSGLAMDGAGNVYVADTGNQTIRKIDPSGNVTTLAGKAGVAGSIDGDKASARLFNPVFLAVDADGDVFVTENKSYVPVAQNPIRKIAPDCTVSSLTVEALDPKYLYPGQICVDPAGDLYVFYYSAGPMEDLADVLKLTPTTAEGKYTATLLALDFYGELFSMSMDGAGSLFIYSGIYDFHVHVYTQGDGWRDGYSAGVSDAYWMAQFAVGKSGELYFTSNYLSAGVIGVGIFDPKASGPVITEQPWLDYAANKAGYPILGNPVTLRMAAVGGPGLTYQWYFNSNPISGATSASWVLGNVQKSDEGYYSAVVTDGDGSVASGRTQLVVGEYPLPTGNGTVSSTSSSGPGSTSSTGNSSSGTGSAGSGSSGGGSFDSGISVTVLSLLAVAALRRRALSQTSLQPDDDSPAANMSSRCSQAFKIAALETYGMKERS